MLKKTYSMADKPPPPIGWEQYSRELATQWAGLLDNSTLPEGAIQSFLEEHPALVPGAFGTDAAESGHGPIHGALFSQPVLPGIERRLPDFMWLSQDSMSVNPVLIELEKPGKKWFTKGSQQTADLSQALSQIAEWQTWFDEPANTLQFLDLYRVSQETRRTKTFAPRFVLVYGRRSEFTDRPDLNKKRAALRPDLQMMTYDRLRPNPKVASAFTVKVVRRDFQAINVTDTYRLGPMTAADLIEVQRKEEAILRNRHMTDERKNFLLKRLEYWEAWARDGARGLASTGDWE